MFTRIRDGTVIPVMCQTIYSVQDSPFSSFQKYERMVEKFTWDETYDDAWEEEEPEFEEGALPPAEEIEITSDMTALTEDDLARRATGGA